MSGIVIITDSDGALQEVLPKKDFKKEFKWWFENIYTDEELTEIQFYPERRFEKFEPVELTAHTEDDAHRFFVQASSFWTPDTVKYLLEYNEYESRLIAIVEANTTEELRSKCMLACKEELGAEDDGMEIDNLIEVEHFNWGVSSAFNFKYMDDGEDSEIQIRITKVVSY